MSAPSVSALSYVRPALEYVEAHFDEAIQVQDAARMCRLSCSHFMFLFKRATGRPFLSYVQHRRIALARELLAGSDKMISEISQDTGFCDQSYFGAMFRRIVGMTPAAYRRRYRGIEVLYWPSSQPVGEAAIQ